MLIRNHESKPNDRRVSPFGEGIWQGHDSIYFTCTEGGPDRKCQIFRYRPSPHEGTPIETTAAEASDD